MRTQNGLKLKQSSLAVLTAMSLLAAPQFVQAGAGWADNTDKSGAPFKQATFYANSPMGVLAAHDAAATATSTRDTGTPLRKFVDSLPLVDGYVTNLNLLAANKSALGRHIPTAIKEDLTSAAGVALLATNPTAHSVSYPDADYYEIAVVEYREQLHSDLPPLVPDATTVPGTSLHTGKVTGGTQLRGYVQIWTPNLPLATPKTPLFYPNGNPILDNLGNPVFAVGDGPHYLGPIISSTSHVAVRIRFDNYLPTGHYDPITKTRGGDSFVPTDYTMPGCGLGPLGAINPNAPQPFERYTQNRTNIHMHGGDTPWISDGEPHDWITPAGENTQYHTGATTQNVPDMPDPGPGSQTLFYPNNQSARMMWYHDHSYGSTRLDVYAGIVSAFMIHDATEAAMQAPATATTPAGALAGMDEIPLIFEDKTFVPKDVMIEDSKWNTDTWGKYGDLWFPHVYEANQNPDSIDGTNPAGRCDYCPWFWPVFPAPLALPTGAYGDVSSTQEQYADTPLLNGVAYPNFAVEPKAYRFRFLNASLQRYVNLGLYVAEPLSVAVNNPGSNYAATSTVTISADANGAYPTATLQITPIGAPAITMTTGGAAYSAGATVTFTGGGAATQATGHPVISGGVILGVVVDTVGSGYTSAPTVTFADTTGTGAAATAALTPGGEIAGIIVNPAPAGVTYSYTTPPTITVTDSTGAGSGATFVASVNTEVPMVPAVMPPANAKYGINTYDGRPGGIPDPAAIGPNIIQIGNEGGFLTQPNVIPSTPVSYEQTRKSVTVLNVLDHGLYVGPAERADFVVDFSQYAGKTLILYNDCPAPNPGFDTRTDYFTGDGDQTGAGGADNTLPGYGPNTRTMMRIQVAATQAGGFAPAAAYDPLGNGGPLAAAIPAAFAASQDVPIVPQSWQNKAYGTNYTDNTAHIYAGTFQQPGFTFNEGGVAQTLTGFQIDSAGTGYTIAPTVTLVGGLGTGGVAATAHAVLDVAGQRVVGIALDTVGSGYTSAPLVVLNGGNGIGASATALTTATQTVQVLNKGIQELFESNYGRMNATFSAELPFTSVLAQTTVPLGYADPATEQIGDGETQFWKVTHNGVDAHVVHFHLFNVQVINRVGWDGTIKRREPSEFGWKETVKMNPLEDIYVAVKPKSPRAPFGVPQSIRPLDPTQPLGSSAGFTQVNPLTGLATTVVNETYNYNWEYVWHCHILGHEENDFMRPMIFDFGTLAPASIPSVSYNPTTQTVSWVDPTPAGAVATYGNKQNEQGFIVQRSETGTFAALPETPPQSAAQNSINPAGANANVVAANATSWHDPLPSTATTSYRVLAFNSAGYSPTANIIIPGTSTTVTTCVLSLPIVGCILTTTTVTTTPSTVLPGTTYTGAPNAPTGLKGAIGAFNYGNGTFPVTLTWNTAAIPKNGFVITRTGGTDYTGNIMPDVTFTVTAAAAAVTGSTTAYTFTDLTGLEISGFKYTVQADNGTATAPLLSPGTFVNLLTPYAPPPVINNVTAAVAPSGNSVKISWTAPPQTSPDTVNMPATSHITGYNVMRTNGTNVSVFAVQQELNQLAAVVTPPATTFTDTAPLPGISTYSVVGVNGNLTGTTLGATSSTQVTLGATASPGLTAATATANGPTQVTVNWAPAPAGSGVTGYRVIRFTGATSTILTTPAGVATSFVDTGLTQNTPYAYVVQWLTNGSTGVPTSTNLVVTPYAPATPVTALVATPVPTGVTLTWAAGGPSTSYVVSRCLATAANANCTNASTVFTQVAGGITALTYTDTTATIGNAYAYEVQAVNGPVNVATPTKVNAYYLLQNGATLGAVTIATTQPTSYTTTGATTGDITIVFTPTAVTNAPAVTGYNLWAYVNGSATPTKLVALAATATSPITYTYTANRGSSFAFYVTEVNSAGESVAPAAASLTAIYNGPPAPTIDTTKLPARNAPTTTSTTDTIVVDWSPVVTSVNNSPVTQYQVQWSSGPFFLNGDSQWFTTAQATTAGTLAGAAGVAVTSTVTGSGPTAVIRTTFSAVARGSAAATPPNTIYFRVNTVQANGAASFGPEQVLSTTTTPKLP